jgi:hypothetical protein
MGATLGGCGKDRMTPTTPTLRPVQIAGDWTGTYTIVSCRGGAQACFGLKDSYVIQLKVQQTADGIVGTITGELPIATAADAVPVTGTIDEAGALHVEGVQAYQSLPYTPGIEVRDWSTAMLGDSSMTGTFHLTLRFRTNNIYPDIWNVDARIAALTR